MQRRGQPSDDPSSAPESGTVRDETSGNNPAKDQATQFTHPARPKKADSDPKKATSESGRDTMPPER